MSSERTGTDCTRNRESITEKALEQARATNERITMILDSITDRFFALDKDWRIVDFNKRAEEQLRVLGKDPAEVIGKKLWDEFPSPPVEAAFRRAMSEHVVVTHEHYYPLLGEWVENRIYPSPDGGLAVFQRYVTERKRAEEQLRRSKAYLAVRPSYPELLQWIHPDDRLPLRQSFERAVREKGDFEANCRVIRPDGTVRYIHSLAHPVFDESGELTEYVGTILDITERKGSHWRGGYWPCNYRRRSETRTGCDCYGCVDA